MVYSAHSLLDRSVLGHLHVGHGQGGAVRQDNALFMRPFLQVLLLREGTDDFAAHDVVELVGLLQGFPDELALGHVEVLESLGNLYCVLVGQWHDHFLEELNLLDDLDEFVDLTCASVLRFQFDQRLYRLLKVFLRMKLMRQFLSQVVPCHEVHAQVALDRLELVLFLAQVVFLGAQ